MNLLAVELRNHGFILRKTTSICFELDGPFVDVLVKSTEEPNMKSMVFRVKENPAGPGNCVSKFHFITSGTYNVFGQNNFNDKETRQLESIMNKHCSDLSFDSTVDKIYKAEL